MKTNTKRLEYAKDDLCEVAPQNPREAREYSKHDALAMINAATSMFNTATGMGTASDKATNYDWGSIQWDRHQLESAYSSDGIAAAIVDDVPDECIRQGFEFKCSGDLPVVRDKKTGKIIDTPVLYWCNNIDLLGKINEADKASRLYGGAAIFMGISGAGSPDEPIDYDNIKTLDYLIVLDRDEIYPDSYYEFGSKKFNEVKTYRLSPSNYAGSGQSANIIAHESRVIRFDGTSTPRRIKDLNNGWSLSLLGRTLNRLSRLQTVEQARTTVISEMQFDVYKFDGLLDIIEGGKDQIMARLIFMKQMKSLLGGIAIDAADDYEIKQRNLSGLKDIENSAKELVGAEAKMPLTRLFGSSPGGLSTDDESGTRWFYDRVAAHQRKIYYVNVMRVLEIAMIAENGPFAGYPIPDWSIEFPALQQQTPAEQAATEKTEADTGAVRIASGVLTPEEVREADYENVETEQGESVDTDGEPEQSADLRAPESDAEPQEGEQTPKADAKSYRAPKGAVRNAQRVKRWIEEHGRDEVSGMEPAGLARMNQLANNEPLSLETVKRMASFNRHRKNAKIDPKFKGKPWKDKGYVAWLAWGGDAGVDWAMRVSKSEINKQDSLSDEDKDLLSVIKFDPYSGIDDPSLPPRVEQMSKTQRRVWVSAFNATLRANPDDEGRAFRVAYSAAGQVKAGQTRAAKKALSNADQM